MFLRFCESMPPSEERNEQRTRAHRVRTTFERVRVAYKLNRTFLVVSGKGKLEQLVRKLHRVTDW